MADLSGELIDGRYLLIRQMASGGMATIYEAVDNRLDRKVAVKIMHPHLAQDEKFVERFIREAKASAALSHPNIVAVQDQGWNQSGIPAVFLVMEMVEGHTLRDYLNEQGLLPIKSGIHFLLPILSALSSAHRIGIVHRDIKPENILISKEGRIKIADFGLAKGPLLGSTMTAESSAVLGSVSYLSPEQVQRGIADSRSDVYSTGITAFEIFTGEKPFSGEEPIQIAYMHVNNRIPRLSEKISGVPAPLDDLIYRATDPDPDKRPRDAGAFHSELEKISHSLNPSEKQMSLELDIPIAPMRPEKKTRKEKKIDSRKEITPDSKKEMTSEITSGTAKRRKVSRRVKRNRFIALALAIALGVGGWYVLIGPGSKVVVPSLLGATEAEVSQSLKPLGLTAIVIEKQWSEEIPSGHVIDSQPSGGGRIEAGGAVKLIISKGPERYEIPQLQNLTPEAAVNLLAKLPVKIGELKEVFNTKIRKGLVITSDPNAGEKVKRETTINLVVSKGIESFNVESYVDKVAEQALSELTDTGFSVDAKYQYDERVLAGLVISQSPAGGLPLPKGSKISLVISKGSQYVYIPREILSITESQARAALGDLALKVLVKKIGNKKIKKVIAIDPKVGSKVKRGSTVTLTVG